MAGGVVVGGVVAGGVVAARDLVPAVVATVVVAMFVAVAIEDARTRRVTVSTARNATAVALGGLGLWGVATAQWSALAQAAIATVLITVIQLIPYLLQPTVSSSANGSEGTWIGRADLRLGVPFAWTLGWFGVGFAIAGFAVALLLGLLVGAATRQRKLPFIPFMAIGLVVGLLWALARTVVGDG